MNGSLYINSQIITALEDLRSCFNQPEAAVPNSPLFNELIDRFVDGDIEGFLRTIGEESLAEKVKGIVIGNSDSEMMRQLVTIITGMEPNVDFDFRSCLEVVETTVKGDKAMFRLRVLRQVNEKPFMIGVIQPGLLLKAVMMKRDQNQFRQDIDKNYMKMKTAVRMGAEILALTYLLSNPGAVMKTLSEKVDQDQLLQDLGFMKFKKLDPNQYQQNDSIGFETDINSDYDIWFFIGKEKVGEISAETIAYNNYCESYGASTYYDADRIKVISENAKKGWSRFQDLLGDAYRYGYGLDKSYKDAFSWYSKSAEKGCASAQCSLGEMYLYGKGVDVDYAEALRWFQKSADQGNAMGQCRLGLMYEKGKGGVDVDLSKAADLYSMAAAQNNSFGQCMLGRLYEKGLGGVTKDINRALELYLKSAMQDDAMGQICLGLLLERQINIDIVTKKLIIPFESNVKTMLLKRLWHYEEMDDGDEMMSFVRLFMFKIKDLYYRAGDNKDAWEKYNWNNKGNQQETLLPAASMGSASCLMLLGLSSKNARLLEKAADQDGLFAVYASALVGLMYENGCWVEKSQNMAKWYYDKVIACFGEKGAYEVIRDLRKDIIDD